MKDSAYIIEQPVMVNLDTIAARFRVDTIACPPPEPELPRETFEAGIEPEPRTVTVGDDSGVLSVISVISILLLLCFKQCRRIFSTIGDELWGLRRRANTFDEHTSGESRVIALMLVQWAVYCGLLMYSALSLRMPLDPSHAFSDAGALILLMCAYLGVQYVAYTILGYTFSPGLGAHQLLKGFTASQAVTGFLLIVPALVAIFYPDAATAMVITGGILYFLGRIVFICKGFRIFYQNFVSLLYFILYLCTLEIVPVILIIQSTIFLVSNNPLNQ